VATDHGRRMVLRKMTVSSINLKLLEDAAVWRYAANNALSRGTVAESPRYEHGFVEIANAASGA